MHGCTSINVRELHSGSRGVLAHQSAPKHILIQIRLSGYAHTRHITAHKHTCGWVITKSSFTHTERNRLQTFYFTFAFLQLSGFGFVCWILMPKSSFTHAHTTPMETSLVTSPTGHVHGICDATLEVARSNRPQQRGAGQVAINLQSRERQHVHKLGIPERHHNDGTLDLTSGILSRSMRCEG